MTKSGPRLDQESAGPCSIQAISQNVHRRKVLKAWGGGDWT